MIEGEATPFLTPLTLFIYLFIIFFLKKKKRKERGRGDWGHIQWVPPDAHLTDVDV